MTTASANASALLKEMREAHPSTRWLILQRVARDFGEGFAATLRKQVEKAEAASDRRARRGRSS